MYYVCRRMIDQTRNGSHELKTSRGPLSRDALTRSLMRSERSCQAEAETEADADVVDLAARGVARRYRVPRDRWAISGGPLC